MRFALTSFSRPQIQHQYTLTDEQGPAHKKTFYVKLKMGEEEYSAYGEDTHWLI